VLQPLPPAPALRAAPSLHYAGLRFELLRRETVAEAREATSCPTSLMLLAQHGDPGAHWERQLATDALGESLTFTIGQGTRTVGVCALLPYRDGVRTATYLHPDARGTGVNPAAKRVLHEAARWAAAPLYATVRDTNERSLAAMRKTFPRAPAELVREPDRAVWVFRLTGAPAGSPPLSARERQALRRTIATAQFGQRRLLPRRAQRGARWIEPGPRVVAGLGDLPREPAASAA
jgi:GNAT superfamily N-acetyltransferase